MKEKYNNRLIFNSKSIFFIVVLLGLQFIFSRSFAQASTWVAAKDADNLKNPLAGNTTVIADAKTVYSSYCTPCHGDKGKGDGPAAPGLNPKPADHTSAAVQGESDGALYWKLTEGR